jgi:putative oxidoreductase
MLDKLIPPQTMRMSLALLVLRLVAGVFLVTHGWGKIQNPFHWQDKAADAAPAFFQALAAVSEFGGGLSLVAGLLAPLACFGIACTMAVAVRHHVVYGGSHELALVYLSVAAALLLSGPGRFSADAVLIGLRNRPWRK